MTPEHRPWPLQFAISWHREPQCWPNWCSLQRPTTDPADKLQLGDVQPSKQMHVASSPEHRPWPLQFVISLQARIHSSEYMLVVHRSHPTPPYLGRQLHVSFLQLPLVDPPQSVSEKHLSSSFSRTCRSDNSKCQLSLFFFPITTIPPSSPKFSSELGLPSFGTGYILDERTRTVMTAEIISPAKIARE